MHKNKQIIYSLALVTLFTSFNAFAAPSPSIEIFASNNTNQIDQQTAYQRMMGEEQKDLENTMIKVMQKNHIQQGHFHSILGTYQMTNQSITADNTERFDTSPYQLLPEDKIFSLAQSFAIELQQESVALFIPGKTTIGEITLTFTRYQPTISEAMSLIQRLPPNYNQAFSLSLVDHSTDYASAKVSSIEWLGSQIKVEDIKRVFPLEKVDFRMGNVYLVYQDGRKEQL